MGELMTILAFGTLGAVSVLAYISARVTEKLKDDPSHKGPAYVQQVSNGLKLDETVVNFLYSLKQCGLILD